ncbi:type II toxin-antitoxin system VapB family antitoxin [Falsiroseomonas sp. HW251]|uniref:type II toxin-antitoxin system VapB family antitoxin n=1 Tax=Falsiroseomonas sp. HW251 TaxID=3390998 RepID=UPI003D311323
MRTNIEIDDKLMEDVLKATGLPTKRAAVEEGLRMLLQVQRQTRIRALRGKVDWKGDLEESRRS